MARTWGEVKTFVAEQSHQDETQAVLSANLLPRWAQATLDRIRSYTTWRWDQDEIDLSWSVASTDNSEGSVLYLPEFIYRVRAMYPKSAAGSIRPIQIITSEEFDGMRPASQYARDVLVAHGYYGVERDNPAAGVVNVAVGAGTGSQSVVLEGLDSNNRTIKETVTVAVSNNSDSINSFKEGPGGLRRVYLTGTATGAVVTVTAGSGTSGSVLERLDSSREREHEHLRTSLYARLTSGGSYRLRYWRRLISATPVDSDLIPIPQEFHDLLELGMLHKLALFRQEVQLADRYVAEFMTRLKELKAFDRRDPARRKRVGVRDQWRGRRRW